MPPSKQLSPKETDGYEWKRETGDIESYKHDQTGGWLHIDPQSNFYDREAKSVTRENALDYAAHQPAHALTDSSTLQSLNATEKSADQGHSL